MRKTPNTRLQWRRWLHRGHRYLGLTATLFVLILASTGLMLNHTDGLALDKRHIETDWLLTLYGIGPPRHHISFEAGGQRISQVGQQLFLNGEPLDYRLDGSLTGAVAVNGLLAVADRQSLILLTPEGQKVEQLSAVHGLPVPVEALGRPQPGGITVRSDETARTAGPMLVDWQREVSVSGVEWARPQPTPPSLLARYRGEGPSLERVLLDLHSGRLFGNAGVVVMDGAAVVFLILALLGVWMWLAQRPKRAA